MSIQELIINLIQKIQNTNEPALLAQVAGWMDAIEESPILPLNEIQRLKIEQSRKSIQVGKFKDQADLFRSIRNT